jgi:hypothetical protein
VSEPEGFVVDDAYGPMRAGEIERAKESGAQLFRASGYAHQVEEESTSAWLVVLSVAILGNKVLSVKSAV